MQSGRKNARRCDCGECVVQRGRWNREVRLVEDVEDLRAKFDVRRLRDPEALVQYEIKLREAWSTQRIAREVAELARQGSEDDAKKASGGVGRWIGNENYRASIERLRTTHPGVEVRERVRFVDDGRVITSAGVSAGIDMALHVVGRLLGEDVARATARRMEYESYRA